MIATASKLAVEMLRFTPQSHRTAVLFESLRQAAAAEHIEVVDSAVYRGHASWLMLWGPGAPNRFEAMRRQVEAGGHVIAFDLAYWDRFNKIRVSIDGPHPQAWVMRRDWPRSRVLSDGIRVEQVWNPKGHVVVAGIGEKATVQYGATTVAQWEAEMIAEATRRGYEVRYRPKRNGGGAIDDCLRGAAALITWHSNVGVDAIRMGVPVICRDGAAAAVCPSEWPDGLRPLSTDLRDRFLANLAWFQWSAEEAPLLWRFLAELLA